MPNEEVGKREYSSLYVLLIAHALFFYLTTSDPSGNLKFTVDFIQTNIVSLPLLPGLPMLSGYWIYAPLSLLQLLSFIFLKKIGQFNFLVWFPAIFSLAHILLLYSSLNVIIQIVFCFFVVWAISKSFPNTSLPKIVSGMLGGVYFSSVCAKAFGYFFNTGVMTDHYSRLAFPWIRGYFVDENYALPLAITGFILEASAVLVLCQSASWMRVGLFASILFHGAVGVTISPSYSILFFFLSLHSLQLVDSAAKKIAKSMAIWTLFSAVILLFLSGGEYAAIATQAQSLFLVFIGLYIFRKKEYLIVNNEKELSTRARSSVALGFSIPICIFIIARLLDLPTPLGFTQYSSINGEKLSSVAAFQTNEKIRPLIRGKWDYGVFPTDRSKGAFLLFAPKPWMRDSLMSELCKYDGKIEFELFNPSYLELRKAYNTPAKIMDLINASEKKVVRCSEIASN
jgi:hypothetical protein